LAKPYSKSSFCIRAGSFRWRFGLLETKIKDKFQVKNKFKGLLPVGTKNQYQLTPLEGRSRDRGSIPFASSCKNLERNFDLKTQNQELLYLQRQIINTLHLPLRFGMGPVLVTFNTIRLHKEVRFRYC